MCRPARDGEPHQGSFSGLGRDLSGSLGPMRLPAAATCRSMTMVAACASAGASVQCRTGVCLPVECCNVLLQKAHAYRRSVERTRPMVGCNPTPNAPPTPFNPTARSVYTLTSERHPLMDTCNAGSATVSN